MRVWFPDSFAAIPKEHTIFRYELPVAAATENDNPRNLVFEVNGSQFRNRAPDRANKKFKMHIDPDII